jgi:hypothetical protein
MNKHPDDYVFGIDKNIQNRMKAKFDPERQAQAQAWLEKVTEEDLDKYNEDTPPKNPRSSFHRALYDGRLLCKALNTITKDMPGKKLSKSGKPKKIIPKISESKMPFQQRENLTKYINACKSLGMAETDCFVSQDLYEGDNIVAVIDQIFALGMLSRQKKINWQGPKFGVKKSDENKREFSAETLAKGKAFVPLQNSGSIAVEKSKGTDHIVMYGKAGTELGQSEGGISQQNAGSIAVEKSKGTDHIVKYGIVGQEQGKSVGGISQQNAGSIAVEKEKGTDHIVRYGVVGQEMGESVGGISQQNEGSLSTSKEKKLDNISRALN